MQTLTARIFEEFLACSDSQVNVWLPAKEVFVLIKLSMALTVKTHAQLSWIVSLISFTIIPEILLTSSQTYSGPTSVDYFRTALFNVNISTLPGLWFMSKDVLPDPGIGAVQIIYDPSNTNINHPVNYYRINIDSSMKSYGKIYITTDCDSLFSNFPISGDPRPTACNSSSLDTVLYILKRTEYGENFKIELMDVNDDLTETTYPFNVSSTNQLKSYIDLFHYDEGEYIVAVGGYSLNTGSYYVSFIGIQFYDNSWYQWKYDSGDLDSLQNISCN